MSDRIIRVVIGVDGCKKGWVAVTLDEGRFAGAALHDDFAHLLEVAPPDAVIAVDIPIGLDPKRFRDCDKAAKKCLGSRGSSIFLVPPAEAYLDCDAYEDAVARCRTLTEKGFSRQAFALRDKIRDVARHSGDRRIHEVHPELSFLALSRSQVPLPRKKTWAGMALRRRALEQVGISLPDDLGLAGAAAPDDVLDAAAAAWTAQRIARREARRLPNEDTQQDPTGRSIAIWT